jgi:hypothetical protein
MLAVTNESIDPDIVIRCLSGYGYRTREPFVSLVIGDNKPVNIPALGALDVAHNMAEAAEAAMTDAFVFEFFTKRLRVDETRAALALGDFRKQREEWRAKHDAKQ